MSIQCVKNANATWYWLLCIVLILLCFGAKADTWTPGGSVERWPHVRMGAHKGIYVPEQGWRFSGNYPDDLSTVVLDEPGFSYLCAGGKVLHISAPAGYWTPTPGTSLGNLCSLWAGQHQKEPLLHMWVRVDSQHGILVASISEFAELRGERATISDFQEFKDICNKEVLCANRVKGYLDKCTTVKQGEKVEKLSMNCFGDESDTHVALTVRRHHEMMESGLTFESSVSQAYAFLKGQIFGFGIRTYDQRDISAAARQCERDLEGWVGTAERENADKANPSSMLFGGLLALFFCGGLAFAGAGWHRRKNGTHFKQNKKEVQKL